MLIASCLRPAFAFPQGASSTTQTVPADHTASSPLKASSAGAPSTTDIAAAKAAGKVWVNLETGIYHKAGRWYGKTKNGKFLTVDEATKAGYKPAKRD
jgi:hypothetical protein